jgi:hypothetical protein
MQAGLTLGLHQDPSLTERRQVGASRFFIRDGQLQVSCH